MAWIILYANGEELRRMELGRPVTIGRAAECDVAVRDILLSRAHCRLEPLGNNGAWRAVDLGSKNGTRVGWQKVAAHVLRDGDWLRMGRTRLTFHVGPFEPAAVKGRADKMVRPADPHEALSGTVTEFVLDDEARTNDEDGVTVEWGGRAFPRPAPRPVDPTCGFELSPLDELATAVGSSGALSSQGLELVGAAVAQAVRRPRMRKLPRVNPVFREIPAGAWREDADLALQAAAVDLPAVAEDAAPARRPVWVGAAIGVGVAVATAVFGVGAWLLTVGG